VKKTRQRDQVRRGLPRRVTPELIAFHKRRAKQLRDQACLNMARSLWMLLTKAIRRS
jgi:hypothetical protein